MITEVRLKDFKTFKDVKVPLGPGITVLVGANNSGKSSFLKALQLVAETVRHRDMDQAVQAQGGLLAIRSRDAEAGPTLTTVLAVGDGVVTYKLVPWSTKTPGVERVNYVDAKGTGKWEGTVKEGTLTTPEVQAGGGHRPGSVMQTIRGRKAAWCEELIQFFDNLAVVDLSLPALRAPSLIGRDVTLGADGENLAAVLDRLDGEQPLLRDEINEAVKRAATEVRKVVTLNAAEPGTKVVGVLEQSDDVFAADQMSDGLLLFIGLSTAARLGPTRKTLVAIEEPDRGIHPRRLREILDQLKTLANAGTQIVLTTHSPTLLDEFKDHPESVLIFDRKGDETSVTRLSDRPEWVKELQDVSLGDLWYSGVLGGVPGR